MSNAPRVILHGAAGRMGRAVAAAATEAGIAVAASVDVKDDLRAALALGDVVVDFSAAAATPALLQAVVAAGKPIVIGTTGHSAAEKKSLAAIAARVPAVWAGNFSVGVNLLFALTERAARVLGDDYDVELIEMHHRLKKDAPSGTAVRLLELVQQARGLGPEALRHGRSGMPGERTRREIGVHALRGGDVIGDHTVIFASTGERIELTHKASDRAVFARGALRAATWVVGQKPGLYDMQDVLGLRA
ncbi:MAG TPA: 4-hydroxy-tetrahydrodipicolinate reductase [Candidatus Didemnitutus sp.]|nr:4-hydroxy-tetrahydrodipicolinate reductase [Candidatus Didemnitutus sp.]